MRILKNFARAAKSSRGVVIFMGDWGGQIYLTCPMKNIKCDELTLINLLQDIDSIEWGCNEGDGAFIICVSANPGEVVDGGMGGGIIEDGLWIHPDIADCVKEQIKKVICGELASIPKKYLCRQA